MSLTMNDMVPGNRYRVSWDDCCAAGSVEGKFIGFDSDDADKRSVALFAGVMIKSVWGPEAWGDYRVTEL